MYYKSLRGHFFLKVTIDYDSGGVLGFGFTNNAAYWSLPSPASINLWMGQYNLDKSTSIEISETEFESEQDNFMELFKDAIH